MDHQIVKEMVEVRSTIVKDVKERLDIVGHEVNHIANACMGPNGHAKIYQPNEQCGDVFTVSSSAERIFQKMRYGYITQE